MNESIPRINDAYDLDALAQRAFDTYYRNEKLSDYLDEDYTLDEVIYDDIHDLLHNGNQEDLFGLQYDPEQLDELALQLHDHTTELLSHLAPLIANLMINKENAR